MQREWDRLRAVQRPDGKFGCWDEAGVREWRDVRREARETGQQAHVGRVFGIVVEKNSELCLDEPLFKGRAVFQRNSVLDVPGDFAIFQELGSCLATMEAARCADAYGLLPGHTVQQSDAEQAYTQAWLTGTPTWVRLPRDQWPKSWEGMTDPVCPLMLALYGHPDSGGHWERRCFEHLESEGFVPIPNWPSCFWHPELKLLLVVYVDDFKLSGPAKVMAKGWSRGSIRTEEPTELVFYLGCHHEQS